MNTELRLFLLEQIGSTIVLTLIMVFFEIYSKFKRLKKKRIMGILKLAPFALLVLFGLNACSQGQNQVLSTSTYTTNLEIMTDSNSWNKLTAEEERVIVNKGTEMIWKGEFVDNHSDGMYVCKRCNAPLFDANSKFDSGSGWPAFDDCIDGSIKEITDSDGRRTEIVCGNCEGHLGHVFKGERFTNKNTRHCVNSISLDFIPQDQLTEDKKVETKTAIFASGCFWGTEYFFEKEGGVVSTQVGYIGGHKDNPTYNEVCAHTTGHAEAVKVTYDPSKTDYETLAKLFFETHDPSQVDRQGPDIGDQYRTEVFYLDEDQKEIAEKLVKLLEGKGMSVATKITEATHFWDGEDYHEHYYSNKGGTPYCHGYTKRF
jgi:peptide methionine sulfoxide reductase msrA/msrB